MQHVINRPELSDNEILKELTVLNDLIFKNTHEIKTNAFVQAYDLIYIYCSRQQQEFDKQGEEIYFLLSQQLSHFFGDFVYENISVLKKQIIHVNLLAEILKNLYEYLELYYIPMSIDLKRSGIFFIDKLVYQQFYSNYFGKLSKILFIDKNLIKFAQFIFLELNNKEKLLELCQDFVIQKRDECFSIKSVDKFIIKANEHINNFGKFFDDEMMKIVSKMYIKNFGSKIENITNFLFKSLKMNDLENSRMCFNFLKNYNTKDLAHKWRLFLEVLKEKNSNFFDYFYSFWIVNAVFQGENLFKSYIDEVFENIFFDYEIFKYILNEIGAEVKFTEGFEIKKNKLEFMRHETFAEECNHEKQRDSEDVFELFKNIKTNSILFENLRNKYQNEKESQFYKEIFGISNENLNSIMQILISYTQKNLINTEKFCKSFLNDLINEDIPFNAAKEFSNLVLIGKSDIYLKRAIPDLKFLYKISEKMHLKLLNHHFYDFLLENNYYSHEEFRNTIYKIEKGSIKHFSGIKLKLVDQKSVVILKINGKKLKTNVFVASTLIKINEREFSVNELSKEINISENSLKKVLEELEKEKIIKIGERTGKIFVDDLFDSGDEFLHEFNIYSDEIKNDELFLQTKIVEILKKNKEINKFEMFEKIRKIFKDQKINRKIFGKECEKLEKLGYLKIEGNVIIYIP